MAERGANPIVGIGFPQAAAVELAARDVLLHELVALEDDELAAALTLDSQVAAAALEALRDPDEHAAARLARALPLVAALAAPAPAAVEHDAPPAGTTPRPLLDHVPNLRRRKLHGERAHARAAAVLGKIDEQTAIVG